MPRRQQMGPIEDDRRCWESWMRTEIPKFHGKLKSEQFLDWLATVERILEFKGLPEDKHIPLVATRLRDRATAWWQQVKLTRNRLGKPKIKTWEKMKKHFVSTAHQMALQIEKQSRRNSIFRNSSNVWSNSSANRFGGGGSSSGANRLKGGANRNTVSTSQLNRLTGSGDEMLWMWREAVQKLGLKTEKHPKPYKLAWLKKGGEIVLVPSKETEKLTFMGGEMKLLSLARFEEELDESQLVYVLIGKEVAAEVTISIAAAPVVAEFIDVFPNELPDGLPPLCDIQHQIDLEPGATLSNRPHYRMSLGKHEELRGQVKELLAKGHVCESLSPYTVPALLTPKKDVLCMLRWEKFYATLKKCVFMVSKVLFIGYVVSDEGLQVDESKVEVVKQWSQPKTITEVRSLHGLASFYRRFISHFNTIMAPITDCMKGIKFAWTEEAEKTFQLIKMHLTTAPILVLLDFAQPFELHGDAYKVGIGVVLSQNHRPVAYFSEKLSGAKLNYNTYDMEFYAIVQAVKH
ncbi:hypothetical protein CRG98_013339 [Punica granatum]|uniref:Reverse transcriptase/retrotransposon-derived protein RNase H-like domain-containing protein n=1 Tax=Punica granatum TaxID=22663 RepID=A0A2I0KCJ4_PUNGR|nr:hypothetical protein CRG98_013339 [Punica granatum]